MTVLEPDPSQAAPEPYEAARVRRADLKDAPALANLYNQARGDEAETAHTMADWLERGGALILENSRGEMLCALRFREEGRGWRVDRIATLPEARAQGYGRWLMTKVEALAIRTNIPTLTLTLNEVRDDLLHYYQRMGYRVLEQAETSALLEKRVGGTWQVKR